MQARKPRQVRKEAAVSGHLQVPRGNLHRLQLEDGGPVKALGEFKSGPYCVVPRLQTADL